MQTQTEQNPSRERLTEQVVPPLPEELVWSDSHWEKEEEFSLSVLPLLGQRHSYGCVDTQKYMISKGQI